MDEAMTGPSSDCKRASTHGHGPDYCAPCSEYLGDWVQWFDHRHLVRDLVFVRERNAALKAEVESLREALGQTDHYVVLGEDGWSIEHLVECRPDMTKCPVHREVDRRYTAEVARTIRPGRYRVASIDPWKIERADDG